MKDSHSCQQTPLNVRKNGRHPFVHRQGFHIIRDQSIKKRHSFRAADEQTPTRGQIDYAGPAIADGGVFGG